jgi:hypothetical protein
MPYAASPGRSWGSWSFNYRIDPSKSARGGDQQARSPGILPSVRSPLPPPSVPGNRLGAFRWRVTGAAALPAPPRYRRRRGWVDLRPSAYGTPRARWCAPATITARVLRSRLQNHVEGRLRRAPTLLKPPAPITSRSRASPACVPSAALTSCDSEAARRPSSNPRNKLGRPSSNCLQGGRLPSARRPRTACLR